MSGKQPWWYLFAQRTFFHTYPYYFAITFTCPNEQTFDMFCPVFRVYVRDRAALYEDKDGVDFVHINCREFNDGGKEAGESPGCAINACAKTWYIGIKFFGYPNYFEDVVDETIHDCRVTIKSFKR